MDHKKLLIKATHEECSRRSLVHQMDGLRYDELIIMMQRLFPKLEEISSEEQISIMSLDGYESTGPHKEWVNILDDNDLGTALICLEDEQRADNSSQFLRLTLKIECQAAEVEISRNHSKQNVEKSQNGSGEPAQEVQSVQPVHSVQPAQSVQPVQSVQRVHPVQPAIQPDVSDFDPLHGEQIASPEPVVGIKQEAVQEPEISTPMVQSFQQEEVPVQQQFNQFEQQVAQPEEVAQFVEQQQVKQEAVEQVQEVQQQQVQELPQQVPQQVFQKEQVQQVQQQPEVDNKIADAFGDAFGSAALPQLPTMPQVVEQVKQVETTQQVPGMTPIAPFTENFKI